MLDRLIRAVSRHRMLSPADRVIAAVSGGPDSVCLLDVLSQLAPMAGATLVGVAHLNHKLRGEASDEDQRFVAALAQRYGVEFHLEKANLPAKGNLEEVARHARRNFFARLIREGAASKVATGHTLDDQAETVLFRLLRGSGPGGISGILPSTMEGLIRPLLEITREQVREYLNSRGFQWREDASNLDVRFSRNRIRHELLPLLGREWNPRISEALARHAEISWVEEQWWKEEIGRVAAHILKESGEGLEADARDIAELPKALGRRLVRHAFHWVRCEEGQASLSHVDDVLEIAAGERGEGQIGFGGVEIIRSFGRLRFQRVENRVPDFCRVVEVPGRYPFPGTLVCFELAEGTCQAGDCASLELLGLGELRPLQLRSWRVGDRYRPVGKSRDYTLHELFQRARVPSWRRHAWPVVAMESRIVWVREFGVASDFAVGRGRVLRIREKMSPKDESLLSGPAS